MITSTEGIMTASQPTGRPKSGGNMFQGILIAIGCASVALFSSTDHTNAQTRDGASPSTYSRHAVKGVRTGRSGVRAHRHSHGNQAFIAGIFQDVLEDVILEAVETGLEGRFGQAAPAPVELEELGAYGVPDFMQPHVYGLLTSPDWREVEQGNMLLMHYQLDSKFRPTTH